MAEYADYYREIYARGLAGEQPAIPVSIAELEERAVEAMEPRARAYVCAGAGSEETMRANREAFRRWRIVPRMLRDVSERSLQVELLGSRFRRRSCWRRSGCRRSSTRTASWPAPGPPRASACPMSPAPPPPTRWRRSPKPAATALAGTSSTGQARTRSQRAWSAAPSPSGYKAIVLTVDTFVPGWKPRDLQQAWLPFLEGTGTANFFEDPVFRKGLERPPEEDVGAAVGHYLSNYENPRLTWDRLAWLREQTELPILLKGILHPEDAREAVERGIAGVIVSNHGGRQVDGAIAALDALPAIVEAVGDQIAVLMDSGIRGGSDVLKALALGADAILLGRPYLWGLALDGQAGVETVLKMLLAELDLTLALTGHTDVTTLGPEALVRELA